MRRFFRKLFKRDEPLPTLGLSAGDICIQDGDRLSIYDPSCAVLKQQVMVQTHTATTLTYRIPTWYEELWQVMRHPIVAWRRAAEARRIRAEQPIRDRIQSLKNSQGKRSMWGDRIDNTATVARLEATLSNPNAPWNQSDKEWPEIIE